MIQSGITFNSVKNLGLQLSGWPIYLNHQQGPDKDGGVVNVVDIDWNGAVLFLKSFCKCSMMLQRLAKN